MNSIKIKKAFTLVELLVGISIISLMALTANNLNFNRLNSKQELEIFTNSIKSNFETIRNSSLLGKGIGANLVIPEKWKIEYSTSNSGTIINDTFDGSNRLPLSNNLIFKPGYHISRIRCLDLNELSNEDITSGTGVIEFVGNNMSLGGCADSTSKILELTIKNKTDIEVILLNTLNGLAEIK